MPVELDLNDILQGAICAPAGCGKSHLICDAISRHVGPKPVLVLTHTNAGVSALKGRLKGKSQESSYRISTIDGWSMRLIGMFPKRSKLDPEALKLEDPRADYPAISAATERLLTSGALADVLASTYSRLIVDEYQDCSASQHRIISYLARTLPTVVLGDPLQAIFAFRGAMPLDWEAEVFPTFPNMGVLTMPHRWINAGEEHLGRWLLEMRQELLAGRSIDLMSVHANVQWVKLDGTDDHKRRLAAGNSAPPDRNGKVIILADSMNKPAQLRYASQIAGAVVAEKVDMSDLVDFARSFNLQKPDALELLARYVQSVLTNFSAEDMLKRLAVIDAARARKEASEIEQAAISFRGKPTYVSAAGFAADVAATPGVRVHRPAMLHGLYQVMRQCQAEEGLAPLDAAAGVRERSRVVGRPLAKRTVGSTLLLKGLEAEMSVILDVDRMDARHFYVASTRGSKKLIVCSHHRHVPA